MEADKPFAVSDQAIIDAILAYTRHNADPEVIHYDPDAPEEDRRAHDHQIVTWFQDVRFVLDIVCARPGFSGLNVLRIAARAMEEDLIAQSRPVPDPVIMRKDKP